MKGQWIGRTSGDQVGLIITNIDDRGDHFSGVACSFPDDKSFLPSGIFFNTKDKRTDFSVTASIVPINPESGLFWTWEEFQKRFPGISHSKEIKVSGHFEENELFFNGQTDLESKIETHIKKNPFSEISDLPGETVLVQPEME